MYLFWFTLIFGSLYVYFYIASRSSKENFKAESTKRVATSPDEVYDEFYSFILDDLFYDQLYTEEFCKIILKHANTVYNNHLCIGIKHGGHINEILRKNMTTKSIVNSGSIVELCKFNYPNNDYDYIHEYVSNSYIYDENTFTQVSLIDMEVYMTNNLNGLLYNISRWITNNGYLYIDLYDGIHELKDSLINEDNGRFVKVNYKYSSDLQDVNNKRFYFNEKIKIDGQRKTNRKEFVFYDLKYIIAVARECGLEYVAYFDNIRGRNPGRSVLVLQKK